MCIGNLKSMKSIILNEKKLSIKFLYHYVHKGTATILDVYITDVIVKDRNNLSLYGAIKCWLESLWKKNQFYYLQINIVLTIWHKFYGELLNDFESVWIHILLY
jgi:hypothetical protein